MIVKKVCSKCRIEKELEEFYKKTAAKDGRKSACKVCLTPLNKENWKKYYSKNRKDLLKKKGIYGVVYYKENKKELNSKSAKYYQVNKERIKVRKKKYNEENKTKLTKRRRERNKENYQLKKIDSLYMLKNKLSRLLRHHLNNLNVTKTQKLEKTLGLSVTDMKVHLNNNPYGFVIGQDKIDIDHIIPISTVSTKKEIIKLNHYTNMQLLPSYYNRHIKSNNSWDKEHFENWLLKNNVKNP